MPHTAVRLAPPRSAAAQRTPPLPLLMPPWSPAAAGSEQRALHRSTPELLLLPGLLLRRNLQSGGALCEPAGRCRAAATRSQQRRGTRDWRRGLGATQMARLSGWLMRCAHSLPLCSSALTAAPQCKHQLASRLAEALGKTRVAAVNDTVVAELLARPS